MSVSKLIIIGCGKIKRDAFDVIPDERKPKGFQILLLKHHLQKFQNAVLQKGEIDSQRNRKYSTKGKNQK